MRRVGFHLTDRCQLDCDHCLRDPSKRPVDLPLERAVAALENARALGIERVSLTGGEPTLHPEFPALLDAIAALGFTWDMVSNGVRFSRVAQWFDEAPARAAACRGITFSLDGATDATHDAIRGPGQRREVLEAMALCVALGVPFDLSAALHARNAHELEALAREGGALGASTVRFAMTQPTGTALDDDLGLPPEMWRELAAHARRLASEGLPVTLAEGWPRDDGALCGPLRTETLHVDMHGRITLCCLLSGLPLDEVDRTVAGDARDFDASLARLHAIQDAAIADARSERTERSNEDDPWRDFGCNACLRRFGRPYWTSQGAAGPAAERERWRGARTSSRRRLAVVA